MGIPQHYSLELPRRCLIIIEELWGAASNVYLPQQKYLGPLTTTFLLSMAAPIISLPLERIVKSFDQVDDSYVDDSFLNKEIAQTMRDIYETGKFGELSFFKADAWSFAEYSKVSEPLNIAKNFPIKLANELATEPAHQCAKRMDFRQWINCLRNALAHGGIAFLDENGHQTFGDSAKMYAFVSGKYDKHNREKLIGIKALRIGEAEFREFLGLWVAWLEKTGISQALAA
jgi:hypothetical protein